MFTPLPVFLKTEYRFHEVQRIKVEVRDQKENQCDIIGTCIFSLPGLLCSEGLTLIADLMDCQLKKKQGYIIVQASKIEEEQQDTISIICSVSQLVSLRPRRSEDQLNSFLRINILNDETGNYERAYESEIIPNSSSKIHSFTSHFPFTSSRSHASLYRQRQGRSNGVIFQSYRQSALISLALGLRGGGWTLPNYVNKLYAFKLSSSASEKLTNSHQINGSSSPN